MKTKIVIEIGGGCVREVRCNDPEAEVVIIDWDGEDESQDARNEKIAKATAKMPVVLS